MADIYAYPIQDALYLNITNRCPNKCSFCIRQTSNGVGYALWLEREPSTEDVIKAIGDPSGYREIVFCGYGEPLLRPELVIEVCRYLKDHWKLPIRINTNGLAEKALGREIAPKLEGLVDIISISLNAQDAPTYDALCLPVLSGAYQAVLDFTSQCKKVIPRVILSIVELPGVDPEACRKVAEQLGVELRVRHYQEA